MWFCCARFFSNILVNETDPSLSISYFSLLLHTSIDNVVFSGDFSFFEERLDDGFDGFKSSSLMTSTSTALSMLSGSSILSEIGLSSAFLDFLPSPIDLRLASDVFLGFFNSSGCSEVSLLSSAFLAPIFFVFGLTFSDSSVSFLVGFLTGSSSFWLPQKSSTSCSSGDCSLETGFVGFLTSFSLEAQKSSPDCSSSDGLSVTLSECFLISSGSSLISSVSSNFFAPIFFVFGLTFSDFSDGRFDGFLTGSSSFWSPQKSSTSSKATSSI